MKDLGMVDAYAFAVSKGYTGTREEFAELMASYATVAEQAAESAAEAAASALTATTAKTDAISAKDTAVSASATATQAAQTATTKASEAAASASSASTDAVTASTAATTATQAAATATTAATTATEKASEASASASAAATSEVNAKAAAQDATESAETLSGSVAQIATNTQDITALKEDLTDLEDNLEVLNDFTVTWGQGNIIESNGASGGSAGTLYSKRLRTVLTPVPEAGFSAELPDNIQMQLFWYSANSTSSYIGCDALGDISNLDSPRGAYVRFVLAYSDPTLAITPTDADVANVHIYTAKYTDASLTQEGKAADAKATGDAIRAAVPAVITVDVNGGADYTSLTKAIYENVDSGETIMVKPGTYDIVQEYVDLFGQSVVDSLADSTDLGGFQYGIRILNRKVIFQPGSHVVCDWTGHTVNGTHRFSAFAVAYNAEIEGLDLDCTATFYAIHDDYGTYQVYYKNVYRNCRLIGHNLVNQNVIGGGCKPYSRTIIDNCYVDNNGSGICVRYHNTNLSQAAEPVVWVSNSYFAQALSFRWYGSQTTKMTAYVNNCHAASITKGAEGSSTNDNVDLITWNNETA